MIHLMLGASSTYGGLVSQYTHLYMLWVVYNSTSDLT